nr:putative Ulp1 protease family catalytic domain, putative transposase, Ptta/En/Spm, plant [Ipomoea batatas]
MAYSGNPGKRPIEDSQESVGDVNLPPISSTEGGRKQTSWVWKHFEKRPVEGSSNRYLVHCKICANMKRIQTPFSWNSGSSGTGTLNRHLMNVHGLRSDEGQLEKGQSQISGYATPGGVDIDAPLPFPLSSSCQHVGDAVGSHVKWPTSFIKVQHEKQCKKKFGHHEKKLELNSSSMPKSLWLLYCYYKRALDNRETIKVILDFDVFGETCTLYVNEEDVNPFCQLMPISYTCIGMYIWSLYKKMMDENKLDKFRFVHPYGVGHLPTTKTDTQFLEEQLENRARALAGRLFDTPPNTTVLVPCNVGNPYDLRFAGMLILGPTGNPFALEFNFC